MMKPYLESIRDRAVTAKYYDLMMSAFDPQDASQRAELERAVPRYTDSKLSYWEQCQEQKNFLVRCCVVPSITPEERQRLVRIFGGAERLLLHPLDKGLIADQLNEAGVTQSWIQFQRGFPALFGFLTTPQGSRKAYNNVRDELLDQSRGMRVYWAKMTLKHWPRYLQGNYNPFDNAAGASRKKTDDAARKLVDKCEAVVAEMEPLGEVYRNRVAGEIPVRDRARTVGRTSLHNTFNLGLDDQGFGL